MKKPLVNLVWLKRDLRIEDHAALFEARKEGTVIALYVVEPDYWVLPDTSPRQWFFIRECLMPLQENLHRLGIPLLFFLGKAETAIERLAKFCDLQSLHSHQETGNYWTYQRDLRVGKLAKILDISWQEHMQHGVFRRLETRNGWASRWDAMMGQAGPPLPAKQEWPLEIVESLPDGFSMEIADPDGFTDDTPLRQKGGRAEGLSLLASFLSRRGETYRKAMSSPLEGADACSRISPHLAAGTISMREAFRAALQTMHSLDRANPAHKAMRQSLVSFIGRLHWHCHFIQKVETSPSIEWRELHPAYRGMRAETDEELLERWFLGQTGWPFFDACMRSLHATGWLNFRMRAMVMAVASYHFWQPWQKSGNKLAQLFTDYEPGIHWPQVQMQSGTTGINTVRIYNPVKQGHDQDPDGVFIKRWVPELAHLEGKALHEPWKLETPVPDYPPILMDHMEAARQARERIWAVRKERGFRNKAKDVLDKHSSRKNLKQPDNNRRRGSATDPDQMRLDL